MTNDMTAGNGTSRGPSRRGPDGVVPRIRAICRRIVAAVRRPRSASQAEPLTRCERCGAMRVAGDADSAPARRLDRLRALRVDATGRAARRIAGRVRHTGGKAKAVQGRSATGRLKRLVR